MFTKKKLQGIIGLLRITYSLMSGAVSRRSIKTFLTMLPGWLVMVPISIFGMILGVVTPYLFI